MTDKKAFGTFIKTRRVEKGYSQKDLAELLFVTEGAVSKWERGISYPDITLIGDICRALEISEHELITASTDTEARKQKREAQKFRTIRSVWFWVPTVAYAVALVTCFICNLAVDHTLSWFFIVLAALPCAYTFVPTVTSFFEKNRLLVFALSTYGSVCLLLFTCAVYTGGLRWFLTACIGVLMGYALVFLPILLRKTKLSRYKFLIAVTAAMALTFLLLLDIRLRQFFPLGAALLVTCYSFAPVLLTTVICTFRWDGFFKASVCTLLSSAVYYGAGKVSDILFKTADSQYRVDFQNWQECINGNVQILCLLFFLLLSAAFFAVSLLRRKKNDL